MKWRINNLFIMIGMMLLLTSCLKNSDTLSGDSTAKMAVVNAVINGTPIDISTNRTKLTNAPVGYGTASGRWDSIYLSFSPGIRLLDISSGGVSLLHGNYSFQANVNYSILAFDSSTHANLVIIQDILQADTVKAKARFYNFVTSADSLSLVLFNITDTAMLATKRAFAGKDANFSTYASFSTLIKAGTYKLSLYNERGDTVYAKEGIVVDPTKIYSFFAEGTTDKTGPYMPQVLILKHN